MLKPLKYQGGNNIFKTDFKEESSIDEGFSSGQSSSMSDEVYQNKLGRTFEPILSAMSEEEEDEKMMTSHNRRILSYEHLIKKNEDKAGNASTDIENGQEDESWSIFLQPYVSIMWHVIFDQINLLDVC